jgi:hypothetical protein
VRPGEVDEVAEHIARQEAHHRRVSFQGEYGRFLESCGAEYDERYVWD